MEKLFKLLNVKTEDEAIDIIQTIATPPVIVTVALDALGRVKVSAVGKPPKDLVERALTEALHSEEFFWVER